MTAAGVRGRARITGVGPGVDGARLPGAGRLLGAGRLREGDRVRSRRWRRAVVLAVAVPVGAAGLAVVGGPVLVGAALAYGTAGWLALRRRALSRAEDALRAAAAVALAGLADDLRAGATPHAALHTALTALNRVPAPARVTSALVAVRRAVVRHPAGDVVAALRAVPGPLGPAFGRLAAAWALTDSGIPLADVVARLDVELRGMRRVAERAAAQTASARATARLVAGLPVVGLGVGELLGARPLIVLTETVAGAACAAAAVALHLIGFALASRLSRVTTG
ncbi:hypothetical protein [Cryptosporangium sp. NPDC051539]|uniref:hypothetical protein n=1 Tax=Cryptosporangium sp. NPDC051539 TaxID=3363962 RepID=UPI003796D43A